MPPGAEQFARSSAYRDRAPKVLVLSGIYPQPGWGVLVEWRNIPRFENLIERTIARLRAEASTNKLQIFTEAETSFHRWREVRYPPGNQKVSLLAE